MLNGQDELVNLNEKFGHLFFDSGNGIAAKLPAEFQLVDKEMFGLCFWCESRSNFKCKVCQRGFCTFCIKNSSSQIKSELTCVVCNCFGISEVINSEERTGDRDITALKDREMNDMLHRFEGLCNNDRLADSVPDSLAAIDSVSGSNLVGWLASTKSNVLSMLRDIEKIEAIVLSALKDCRQDEIEEIALPLLRVLTKHHVFRRLAKASVTMASICSAETFLGDDDTDDERTQRSPLRLVDEEKSTLNFEIKDESEPEEPPPIDTDSSTKQSPAKRRRTRPPGQESERRSTRLRSDSIISNGCLATPVTDKRDVSFNVLQSDLSEAVTLFKKIQSTTKKPPKRTTPCKTEKIEPPAIDITEWKPKRSSKTLTVMNRHSSSSSSIGSGSAGGGGDSLQKFTKVMGRRKNSHLVCAAPITYDKPFLIKQPNQIRGGVDSLELDEDIVRPLNKTWSWERSKPSLGPVANLVVKKNGELPKLIGVTPQFLIKHSKTLPINGATPITTTPPPVPASVITPNTAVSKRHTPPTTPTDAASGTETSLDSGEPRKKRGRPRKYFSNFSHELTVQPDSAPQHPVKHDRHSELDSSRELVPQ